MSTTTAEQHELKKVMQPVGFAFDEKEGKLSVENRYDFADLSHLSATYKIEAFGNG